jgi:hypothetical protein
MLPAPQDENRIIACNLPYTKLVSVSIPQTDLRTAFRRLQRWGGMGPAPAAGNAHAS